MPLTTVTVRYQIPKVPNNTGITPAEQFNQAMDYIDDLIFSGAAAGTWKPPVTNVGDLPLMDPVGTVRVVTSESRLYVWTGVAWIPSNEGALTYKGTWDASTNTPTLSDATGTQGNYYVVSVGGTQDLGSGPISFSPADWVVHNGTIWQKADHTDVVTSVFGRQGAVTAQSGDYTHAQIGSVGPDDHHARDHRATHISGGADAFLNTDLLEAIVKRVQESGGPTDLLFGAVADGQVLQRSGTSIVGITGAPPAAHKDTHKLGGTDAFVSTDLLDAVVRRLRETGGPTDLLMGAVGDNAVLRRSGSSIVGSPSIQGGDITNEPHGFTNTTDSTISFTDGTLTFSIQPTGAAYDIYIKGVRYNKTGTESAVITDTEGLWFFYFNSSGTLTASQTVWDLLTEVPVAYIYWDAVNNVSLVLGEERHGVVMDSRTHEYLHLTVGTRYWKGLGLTGTVVGDGSADSHAQVDISDGDVFDEDLLISIRNNASPTPPFEQVLSPTAQIPIYYKSGAGGPWRKWAATNFPVHLGTSRIVYNLNTAGTWTTPDATANGDFVAMWLFATNDVNEPVVAVLGQREDSTLYDAQSNNTFSSLDLTSLFTVEAKILYRLIFQTDATYANSIKARLRDITDARAVQGSPAGTFVPPPGTVFGTAYNYSHVTAETSFTGTTAWENHLVHTTPVLQPGVYIVRWNYNWSYSVTNRNMSTRVYLDSATIIDGPLLNNLVAAYPSGYDGNSGAYVLDLTGVAAATHTIALQGLAANAADTQYMKNKNVEVYRVS